MKTHILLLLALMLAAFHVVAGFAAAPETVRFQSSDGKTELTGYLFKPATAGPHPAIVMLHGRGGLYSALKRGTYTADTLTMRHNMWGEFWASRGYLAMLVDSFGPRGYADGFPKHSYTARNTPTTIQAEPSKATGRTGRRCRTACVGLRRSSIGI